MSTGKKKCPLCNRKLVQVNGVYTCPDCGYRDPQGSTASGTSGGTDTRPSGSGSSGNRPSGSGSSGNRPSGSGSSGNKLKGVIVGAGTILAVIVAGVLLTFLRSGLSNIFNSAADAVEDRWSRTPESEASSAQRVTSAEEKTSQTGGGVQSFTLPKSALLTMLTEEVFRKPVNQITGEELNSIYYLEIYEYDDTDITGISVMLADGTELYYWVSGYDIDTADLSCLTGLEYLLLETGSVGYNTDWHSLKQLRYLSCDASLKELAERMDVSQLVWLHTRDTFGMYDLKILSEYTALEYLELEAGLLDSIEGISQAASLRNLWIEGGDRISDFSELYDMPNLEALSIESQGLKDIGFISGMDQLYLLELKGTDIRNINAVADCADTLQILRLDDNYQVSDISPVMACTGLSELQLWVDYQFDVPMEVPDFSAMKDLRILSLDGYDRFTNLALLPWLEELSIECPGSGDGEPLKKLTSLKTLRLLDMSVFDGLIDGVTAIDGLEYLDLEDSFIWCDISPLLEMPNLQGLNLRDAEFGLRPERMTVSKSLISLDLTKAEVDRLLEDGGWDYGGTDTVIPMQEVLDALAPCVPNLEWLYVPRHELDNLNFAEKLPQLVWLDISDNYITDLTPLIGLENLSVLLCEDNPIRSTEGLENVMVCD
ncbi:MAG: hypothetical protein NC541_01905 [bacterium]|nr:hypothetical protein [bacterium]